MDALQNEKKFLLVTVNGELKGKGEFSLKESNSGKFMLKRQSARIGLKSYRFEMSETTTSKPITLISRRESLTEQSKGKRC